MEKISKERANNKNLSVYWNLLVWQFLSVLLISYYLFFSEKLINFARVDGVGQAIILIHLLIILISVRIIKENIPSQKQDLITRAVVYIGILYMMLTSAGIPYGM